MRESRTSGSVRGVARKGHPYLDSEKGFIRVFRVDPRPVLNLH